MGSENRTARVGGIVATLTAGALLYGCGGGAPSYQLTVVFNASITQADMDEVGNILRRYDSGAEMLVTETFPPVGHATLKTGSADFCARIRSDLEKLSSVQSVGCERLDGGSPGDG